MNQDRDAELALALELAAEASAIIMPYFRNAPPTETKPDLTPVTIADRRAEQRMREIIRARFPAHGVIGEEFGHDRADAEHVWILDPIDGTKSFVSGRQIFGTLIALWRGGKPLLGVINCPAIGDRWIGRIGEATTHNGKPCRTRDCASLAQAVLYTTSPYVFTGADRGRFEALQERIRFPVFGNDCHGYGLVASGYVDLCVEALLGVYDYAPLIPIIEGAGGVISRWNGEALGLVSDGRAVLAGDARCHRLALELLGA
jgi:histidinol phosphatase-like enzyme (inositol monophosphatase family)